MINSLEHANTCVKVGEKKLIKMMRIEFYDIVSEENFEMDRDRTSSSCVTSNSERRHYRRSALSVWYVCVDL